MEILLRIEKTSKRENVEANKAFDVTGRDLGVHGIACGDREVENGRASCSDRA